jgi:hypothetical protein
MWAVERAQLRALHAEGGIALQSGRSRRQASSHVYATEDIADGTAYK